MALDSRLADAKLIPIMEVAHRLGISDLRRSGVEHVGYCPVCGGRGPATNRFAINSQNGAWLCRKCDAGGDGLALVRHVLGCDFIRALDFLVGQAAPEIDERALAARREAAKRKEEKRAREAAQFRKWAVDGARETWNNADEGEGTLAAAYLSGRKIGLPAWPPTLRFIADHPMIKRLPGMDRAQEVYRGPAMIAAIQDKYGKVSAVHQTWLDPDTPGKKARVLDPSGAPLPAKLVRGSKKGGAIRLGKVVPGCTLVVGEGIETTASALVAWRDPGAVFWAGVDLGNMAGRQEGRNTGVPDMSDLDAFVPPADVAKLIYLQDGDSDPKTTRAKLEAGLRRAARIHPHIDTRIAAAPAGKDFNDIL